MTAPAPQPPKEPVKCARPGCRNTFTPRSGKRYCSRTCQGRCHAYRFALADGIRLTASQNRPRSFQ